MTESPAAILRHFRPRLWALVWLHCLAGFVVALGTGVLEIDAWRWMQGIVAAGLWAAFLVGAGAALNDAFSMFRQDTTEGDPYVTARERLGWVALAALLVGMALSLLISWPYWDAYRLSMLLLALYVAPPLRLARWTSTDFLTQALGFGALTFYAGIAAADAGAPEGHTLSLYALGFFLLFIAVRAFFREAAKAAPWLYWAAVAGSFACFVAGSALAGNRWAAAMLIVPLGVWTVAGLDRFDARGVGRFRGKAAVLGAWLLTDAAVILAALVK
jgi:hypothetical protein